MGAPKRLHRTASASRVKRLQYKPLHNLYLFRCWIWYLRDQVSPREGPLRARWNCRGTLSNWDTNATGLRNFMPGAGLLICAARYLDLPFPTKLINVMSNRTDREPRVCGLTP